VLPPSEIGELARAVRATQRRSLARCRDERIAGGKSLSRWDRAAASSCSCSP